MVIYLQSDIDLGEQQQSDRSCYRICLIESNQANKNWRRAYIRYEEIYTNLNWRPHTEAYPSQLRDDHEQNKTFVCDVEKNAGRYYDVDFTASSGRFKRFKNLYSLRNLKVSSRSASADTKEAEEFLKTLDKLILEKNYLPEQILNVDENFLFWKRMPQRTFVHKKAKSMSCFKAFKDRITVLHFGSVLQTAN